MSSLCQLIRRAGQVNGNGVATVFGARTHTWAEFGDRVARLAGGLRSLGVGPNDRVAMLGLNSDRYYEYFFAVPWAGGVFVPINTRLAPAEMVYWLSDSETKVLFIDDTFLEVLPTLREQVKTIEEVIYIGEAVTPDGLISHEALIEGSSAVDEAGRSHNDLAGLFYTGGTTGRSKGVMLSHHNLSYNVLQVLSVIELGCNDRFLHVAPMFHIADGLFCICAATVGAGNYILPGFDPLTTLQAIQDLRINRSLLVPTMVNMVVNHPEVENFDLTALDSVTYGASPMPEAVIERAMEVMPHVRFFQAYGQTETSPALTVLGSQYHVLDGPNAGKLKSCGQAIPGVEIAIFDENDNEVPRGTVGQICAQGDNVMLGYWNMPDVTAETLRGGWIHTGDGGYMDEEGFVYIVDRVKDMIISGGENVYSVEVENVIYQHPSVAECAVIGVPDEQWGERVHAIVRLKDGMALGAEELLEHCKGLIAGFKCPRSVDFTDTPLPVSGAGKILKRELRAPYWEGQTRSVS